jgi:CBS domain containing-hemolysin-like protein
LTVGAETFQWIGFGLSFLAAFALSLLHNAVSGASKIWLSRTLEDRDKTRRTKLLDTYEETRLSVEVIRLILIIAFLVYFFVGLPGFRLRPLLFFLAALVPALLFFDFVPRLINASARAAVVRFFLPAFGLLRVLGTPFLAISRRLIAVEEEKEEEERDEGREATEEEIKTFIDEAHDEGIIDRDEDQLLRNVVEFGDRVVREIMTPRVNMVAIRRDATIDQLKDLIIREKFSRIPVYKERLDNVEGLIHAKDILAYADEKNKPQSIVPLLRPVSFVPETMELADLLKEFQKTHQKLAVSVDEHGGVSGLVTMEDLLEELVGEIQDEYDTEEARIHQNAPLDFTVSGAADVEELEELFDVELAEDDFVTVGGLITRVLGRLPRKGERLTIKGLNVEVLDVDQKKVKKVRLRKPDLA